MPIGQRVLRVTLHMPAGDVTLDETLDLKVKIQKAALAQQQTCEVFVSDLSVSLRTSLITQFTAWNKRNIENAQPNATQQSYIDVTVQAGYQNPGQPLNVITIFFGQVVLAGPVGELPNMGVKITCYSQQISKVQYITQIPAGQMTFKSYATFVAAQMGLNLVCQTSYDTVVITNPGASVHTVGDLLIDLQSYYRPNVAAYVDNNTLIVRDVNAVISTASKVTIDEFINGMPLWDEWGCEFECLFNTQLLLSCAAMLVSKMNPGLNNVGYVIYALEYNLTSRDTPFNIKANGAPPA